MDRPRNDDDNVTASSLPIEDAARAEDMELGLKKKKDATVGVIDTVPAQAAEVDDDLRNIYDMVDAFRTNSFVANPLIGVLVAYPLGIFLSQVLPKGKIFGEFTLNPGKFSHKEHGLIYIFCNSGANTAYALYNIIGQRYKLGQNLSIGWAIVFAIVTQIFGYGLAGLCRRYLVRPAAMLWPTNLSIIAMLNSLHEKSNDDEQYKTSRFSFFWIASSCAFAYQFFPLYIMPVLSAVSWLCWVTPLSSNTHFLASAQTNGGMGLLSLSFDWNIVSTMFPITSPLWAILNQMVGLWLFMWIITPIMYFNNAFGIDQRIGADPSQGPNGTDSEFPFGRVLNSPALFNRDGLKVPTRAFVHTSNLSLNEPFYQANAPIYLTTYFALEYACSFLVFFAALVHVGLWYGADIWHRFRTAIRDLDKQDVHAQLMDAYPDVPDLWYGFLLLANIGLAIAVCQVGGFDLPWWGVILGFALACVSILPIGIIQAISGQQIGLNVMSEFMIGLILPGRIAAVMAFKTLSYMSMYQGLSLVADLKLGHYMKIPPRALFVVQLYSTIVASLINVLSGCWIYESFGRSKTRHYNDDDPTSPFIWRLDDPAAAPVGWTANGYNVFLSAGAIWGAIGPARFFGPGSPYYKTLFAFIVGAVAPLIPYYMHKAFPNGYWNLVNIPLIAIFPIEAGQLNSSLVTPFLLAFVVNYVLKKYRHAWWRKYAYVLSASLDSGLAFSLLVVFFAFQYNAFYQIPFPTWIGNPYDQEHCAPDYWLTCNDNYVQGSARNQSYDFTTDALEPFICKSLHIMPTSARQHLPPSEMRRQELAASAVNRMYAVLSSSLDLGATAPRQSPDVIELAFLARALVVIHGENTPPRNHNPNNDFLHLAVREVLGTVGKLRTGVAGVQDVLHAIQACGALMVAASTGTGLKKSRGQARAVVQRRRFPTELIKNVMAFLDNRTLRESFVDVGGDWTVEAERLTWARRWACRVDACGMPPILGLEVAVSPVNPFAWITSVRMESDPSLPFLKGCFALRTLRISFEWEARYVPEVFEACRRIETLEICNRRSKGTMDDMDFVVDKTAYGSLKSITLFDFPAHYNPWRHLLHGILENVPLSTLKLFNFTTTHRNMQLPRMSIRNLEVRCISPHVIAQFITASLPHSFHITDREYGIIDWSPVANALSTNAHIKNLHGMFAAEPCGFYDVLRECASFRLDNLAGSFLDGAMLSTPAFKGIRALQVRGPRIREVLEASRTHCRGVESLSVCGADDGADAYGDVMIDCVRNMKRLSYVQWRAGLVSVEMGRRIDSLATSCAHVKFDVHYGVCNE
ncbi:hypothetical protein HK101_009541 [Irineochytrium annulatum]|nr:hypothetical protein HK101_009541 [Irineochytrium annulatum]